MVPNSIGRRQVLKAGAGVAAVGSISLAGCLSGDGDGSYPSGDITWIVPYGAGGGYDAYSRAIAQYMPDHLPNDVDIVVENRPGGGGRTGGAVIHQADPDGHTIGMIDTFGTAAYQTVIEPDFDDFDITEFSYFGTAAWEPYGFWTAADSEYETVEDLQGADEVSFAETGIGSAATHSAIVAVHEMEINDDMVFGYEGTAESMTAVIRGDADVTTVNPSTARSVYDDGEIRPIVVFDNEPIEWASESQAAGDLGYEGIIQVGRFERALGTTPDTPDDIMGTLEESWLATAEDDRFIQWSEDNNRPIQPEDAETTQQNVLNAVETFQEFSDVFEQAMQEN